MAGGTYVEDTGMDTGHVRPWNCYPLLTLTLPKHGVTVTNSLPFSVQRTNWVSCRISGES